MNTHAANATNTTHHAEQFDNAVQQEEAATLGMWVFLATELMFFGPLFFGYYYGRTHFPDGFAAAYKAYVEGGWGTIGAPEAWGGQGLPFVLQAAVLETLGAANMSLALAPTLTVGAIEALTQHGSPEQQAAYLPHLVTGAWTGTMNLTEPQAGSDVGALKTKASPRGDGRR